MLMCATVLMCALTVYVLCASTWAHANVETLNRAHSHFIRHWGHTGSYSMAWTPTVAIEQPSAHLSVILELWKTDGAIRKKLALLGDHAQKWMLFYLFSHYKLKTLQGCGILPAKTACKENEARRGEIERQRAERSITEKAWERWSEVFVLHCSFWLFYSSTAWFYWWVV